MIKASKLNGKRRKFNMEKKKKKRKVLKKGRKK